MMPITGTTNAPVGMSIGGGSLGPGTNTIQTTAPTNNQYLLPTYSSPTNTGQVLGASTTSGAYSGSGTGGSTVDYSPNIASLNAQIGSLRNVLTGADGQLSSGLSNINSQYNQQESASDTSRSRALEDFATQNQNDNLGHQQAIDGVNTKARTLANSVRQMIGNASGSGSSAYQIAAPDAVQRQADLQSQDINNTFGQNITGLQKAESRAKQDFDTYNTALDDTHNRSVNDFTSGIYNQKQQINGQLADLAAQLAAYQGGGTGAAEAAAHPYLADSQAAGQAIKDIASKYQSPYQSITPVTVAKPTLRDYVTGQTQVSANPTSTNGTATTPTYNPLASWLRQDDSNQYAL